MTDSSHILRPIPRRTFELTPASTESSIPPSPNPERTSTEILDDRDESGHTPSKTRSILNLTSSTLLGIYSPTGYGGPREDSSTPWGTGAQTPSMRSSIDAGRLRRPSVSYDATRPPVIFDRRKGLGTYYIPLLLRGVLLFGFGIAYGTIITRLHDNHHIAPVKVEGINRHSWFYMVFWGVSGIAMGSLLPWVDSVWESYMANLQSGKGCSDQPSTSSPANDRCERDDRLTRYISRSGGDWSLVVRGIGAFVGIALAIRKLPWQSTLQASLTLALANPVLWYLIDRSKPGFVLSATVGVAGTLILLGINPDIVPSPASPSPAAAYAHASSHGMVRNWLPTQERVGLWTWLASVLFCSCVCFGNIGRRLALGVNSQEKL